MEKSFQWPAPGVPRAIGGARIFGRGMNGMWELSQMRKQNAVPCNCFASIAIWAMGDGLSKEFTTEAYPQISQITQIHKDG